MDEQAHVIFTVDIAESAVCVVGILFLVSYHGILRGEVLEAVFECALDLHLERSSAGKGWLVAGKLLGLYRAQIERKQSRSQSERQGRVR